MSAMQICENDCRKIPVKGFIFASLHALCATPPDWQTCKDTFDDIRRNLRTFDDIERQSHFQMSLNVIKSHLCIWLKKRCKDEMPSEYAVEPKSAQLSGGHDMNDASREQKLQDILVAYLEKDEAGLAPPREELLAEHPEFAEELRVFLDGREKMEQAVKPLKEAADVRPSPQAAPTIGPDMAAPTDVGAKIRYFGDYELLEEIARGGMGVVYKARQTTLKRIVALKMILSGHLAGEQEVKRFYAEAESAAKLDHPNIVPIFEIGAHDGQHYFSMAFVEGESLARKVANGPLPPRESAQLMKKITEAVAYAHVEGVIHRDLKPANVLLDKDGEPHLTDFGLAKRVTTDNSLAPDLTATGQVLGTPSYMPPEQAAAKTGEIGPLSDVYSLGAMLYCLLTGRPPFQASTPMDTLLQVLDKEPVPVRQLNPQTPRDLETICLKCLEKEPNRRYASAHELAADLDRWLAGKPISARRTTPWERAVKWVKRRPALAGFTATAALLLLTLGIGGPIVAFRQAKLRENAENQKKIADEKTTFAQKKSKEALDQKKLAEEERDRARWFVYVGKIRMAQNEWENGHASQARAFLDSCQWNLRGWEHDYLNTLIHHRGQRTFKESDYCHCVVYSPDGTRLASTGSTGVNLWDVKQGTVLFTLKGHTKYVTSVRFSPKGKMLASCSKDAVIVWDTVTGKQIRTLPGIGSNGRVAFSPDGTRLAAMRSLPAEITLWDLHTWKAGPVLKDRFIGMIGDVTFSPDGTLIATACGTSVYLWDASTGKVLPDHRIRTNHLSDITRACFSPDGKLLATASSDRTVKVWDAHKRDEVHTLKDHTDRVNDVCFSADGKRVASAGRDGKIHVWDVKTGQQLLNLK